MYYSINEAALIVGDKAHKKHSLPNKDIEVLAAHSHGGQSIIMLYRNKKYDITIYDKIFLIDAVARLSDVTDDKLAATYTNAIIDMAGQGVDMYLYASSDSTTKKDGSKTITGNTVANIELIDKYAKENKKGPNGETIKKIKDGVYQVKDINGNDAGTIETKILPGTHGQSPAKAAPYVAEKIYE